MSKAVTGINPDVLRWARERSGHSLDDVALIIKKNVDVIEAWESGTAAPTYVQLEKLASQVYKRPVALFFFPQPPEEPNPIASLRTLPDFEIENLSSDTRLAFRTAEAMQHALVELNNGVNPSERQIFHDIMATPQGDPRVLAQTVREYLDISLENQVAWKGYREALESWRDLIQDVGIFVFKRSFKQKDISGFCLLHEQFPVIYLNNGTTLTRQIFSLFHELLHVLLSTNSLTKTNEQYIDLLAEEDKQIEVLCNRFAAKILVPDDDFSTRISPPYNDERISSLAERYKVSREVILRKLLDGEFIGQTYYETKTKEWTEEAERSGTRQGSSGGNYYATQATYLGSKYLDLAFGRYYQGQCTLEQLAEFLNVKVKNISGLERFTLQKATL